MRRAIETFIVGRRLTDVVEDAVDQFDGDLRCENCCRLNLPSNRRGISLYVAYKRFLTAIDRDGGRATTKRDSRI